MERLLFSPDRSLSPPPVSDRGTTYHPNGDVRVCRAGHHLVIFAAAVETPHLVLMAVQRLYALVGFYGPQFH